MYRRHRRAISCLLAVTMTLFPSATYCQAPTDSSATATTPTTETPATTATPAAPAAARPDIDLGYVTPETMSAVIVYPRHVLTSPGMELMPLEVLTAWGVKELGIDPLQVESILAVAEPPQAGPPGGVAVVKTASPLPEGEILGPLWERTKEDQLDGKSYRRGKTPMDPSIFRADDRTLLVGTDAILRKALSNHAAPKEGKMSTLLGGMKEKPDLLAIVLVEPIRPLIAMPLAMVPMPPGLEDLRKLPDLITSIGVKVNVTDGVTASLAVRANDEAAAKEIEAIVDKAMDLARQQAAAEIAKQAAQSSDPVDQAMAKYSQRMSDRMLPAFRPVRKGNTLTLALDGRKNPQMVSVTVIGLLVGMTIPAVSAAREAAQRAQSANNLKQISLCHVQLREPPWAGSLPGRTSTSKASRC